VRPIGWPNSQVLDIFMNKGYFFMKMVQEGGDG